MKKKHILWIILGIIGVVFLFIFLATMPRCIDRFDFTQTGPIGDTIGGLSAPIIGIAGICFVYIAFDAQRKGNKTQDNALTVQIKALEEEKIRLKAERWHQFNVNRYLDLHDRLNNIELIVLKSNTEENLLFNMEPVIFKGVSSFYVLIDLLNNKKDKNFTNSEMFSVQTFVFKLINIVVDAFEIINELDIDIDSHFDEAKDIFEKIQSIKFLQSDFIIKEVIVSLDHCNQNSKQLSEVYNIFINEINDKGNQFHKNSN